MTRTKALICGINPLDRWDSCEIEGEVPAVQATHRLVLGKGPTCPSQLDWVSLTPGTNPAPVAPSR